MDRPLFEVAGKVQPGKHIGRTLGFPTANIGGAIPPDARAGVYAGLLLWGDQCRPCVANIGRHPTLPEGPATVEAHVPGFSGSLYGEDVRLKAMKFLRPERKFGSVQALKEQLGRDVAEMKGILGE